MNYVIFSIDNVTDTHTLAKFLRHFDTQVALSKTKGYLKPCIGSYKGKLEQSFICHHDDYLDYVEPYGATANQESVLWLNDGDCFSCDPELNEEPVFLGELKEVSKKKALKSEGFTYRPDLDTYWVIK